MHIIDDAWEWGKAGWTLDQHTLATSPAPSRTEIPREGITHISNDDMKESVLNTTGIVQSGINTS
jgi:hypothetical protein